MADDSPFSSGTSTPKRRKLNDGQSSAVIDLVSSDTELPTDAPQTIATLPLSKPFVPTHLKDPRERSSSPGFITQPTQILDTPVAIRNGRESVVQVAASSPFQTRHGSSSPITSPAKPKPAPPRPRGGVLASAMAPPGTTFRRPLVTQRAPARALPVDLSDEDPPFRRDSSSEDELSRSDIKPTVFSKGGKGAGTGSFGAVDRVEESPDKTKTSSFRDTLSKFSFSGQGSLGKGAATGGTGQKRATDDMAGAYGSGRRGVARPVQRQSGPAKAMPVQEDITLDDIQDWELRKKVEHMKSVYGNKTILELKAALLKCKGNYEDALNLVAEEEERRNAVDLTVSDDESNPARFKEPPKLAVKRQVKAPGRTIADKWSSTQAVKPAKEVDDAITITSSPAEPEPKPRRRLIQGRKARTSPETSSPARPQVSTAVPAKSRKRLVIDDEEDIDEGIEIQSGSDASEEDEEEADEEMYVRLLGFLNTCSLRDLMDISSQPEAVCNAVIEKRPYKKLDQIRKVSVQKVTKTGAVSRKKPEGEKLMDACEDMWKGYEAVDQLVKRCEELGKPLAKEMEKWGFDVFGAAKNGGELDFTNLEQKHDSALGTPASADTTDSEDNVPVKLKKKAGASAGSSKFLKQPEIMSKDFTMKDYQVVGLNWLSLLFSKRLSCILADDMGLGKTCQVIAFLAHLVETGVTGPHLVFVPASTLENWLREFQKFCPALAVEPYYGLQKEREEMRYNIETNINDINVIVTTYEMAVRKHDVAFLRKVVKPVVCVYDEGHMLKNSNSARYEALMKVPAKFRLLLTGTPLQNNLQELAALLGFIMPDVFAQHQNDMQSIFKHRAKTTDSDHAALLSAQRIDRARSMITPFVLRRKKHQVLKDMPAKHRRIQYCGVTELQQVLYDQQLAKARQALEDRAAGRADANSTANVMMALRKAAIHPMLFRHHYSDKTLQKMSKDIMNDPDMPNQDQLNQQYVLEDMEVMTDFELMRFCEAHPSTMTKYKVKGEPWMDSGKIIDLCDILKKHKANGDRTLVFSQFTQVMDILELVMQSLGMEFFRLDGSTKVSERQDLIDEFYHDTSVPVFMLSTKAGGSGINLACANKVIIFDSSFNPQEDVQAENRAHRVGQTREVEVIRLVTRGTIEEQILALGESKLVLDQRVAGEGAAGDVIGEEAEKKVEAEGMKTVEKMLAEKLKVESKGEFGDQGKGKGRKADVKKDYLNGLKAAGLDMSAA